MGFSEVFLKREKDYATEKHWDLWHKENSYTDLTRREKTEAKTWKTKGAPPVKARECLTGGAARKKAIGSFRGTSAAPFNSVP